MFLYGNKIDPRCRKYTAKAMGFQAIKCHFCSSNRHQTLEDSLYKTSESNLGRRK